MALDAETRLVLAVVPGARDAEAVGAVVDEVKGRTGGRVLDRAHDMVCTTEESVLS